MWGIRKCVLFFLFGVLFSRFGSYRQILLEICYPRQGLKVDLVKFSIFFDRKIGKQVRSVYHFFWGRGVARRENLYFCLENCLNCFGHLLGQFFVILAFLVIKIEFSSGFRGQPTYFHEKRTECEKVTR